MKKIYKKGALLMKLRYLTLTVVFILMLVTLCACSDSNGQGGQPAQNPGSSDGTNDPANNSDESGEVTISFDFVSQSGSASNQFAVWIENKEGDLIKTLYATRFTTGSFDKRPESIPLWVDKSGVADMTRAEIDTFTSSTPRSGELSYTWDLTDIEGREVKPGEYQFFVEGTLRWKNSVLYTGTIDTSGNPATVQATSKFNYEASDNQASLSASSPESSMIGPVTAEFTK